VWRPHSLGNVKLARHPQGDPDCHTVGGNSRLALMTRAAPLPSAIHGSHNEIRECVWRSIREIFRMERSEMMSPGSKELNICGCQLQDLRATLAGNE
jgi:hypothetical protein